MSTRHSDVTPTENRESLARDQLANERTFLAWVRTGLGIVGLGVVVERLGSAETGTKIAGVAFIAVGTAVVGYGYSRYRAIEALLATGRFRAARRGPLALLMLCLLLALAAIAVFVT
ncbi:MAG: DUF202 domain-containing protein [Polyangiaceae bacterium]|nr:DUF202 domain-containing protein [Polyangiaceae bacterium]